MDKASKPEYAFIVLAAGESKRFGENKLLYEINGKPILKWVLDECSLDNFGVVVVTGFERDKIEGLLKTEKVTLVYNPNFKDGGMSSSIKVGVSSVLPQKAYLITPGDMPYLRRWICEKIISYYESTKAKIIVPTFEGRGGHPILVDVSLREDLLSISEELKGLKGLLNNYQTEIHRLELGTSRILIDIDYKEDLKSRVPVDKNSHQ